MEQRTDSSIGGGRRHHVGTADGTAALVRVPRTASLPLSFGQERLWFLQQLDQTGVAQNVLATIRFSGAVTIATLERALDVLVARHEILRTTFGRSDGRPLLTIHSPRPIAASIVDIRGEAEAGRAAERERLARQDLATPFDVERGPLVRVTLIQASDDEWELLIGYHRLIGDRRTATILAREIADLCRMISDGGEPSIPEPSVQYVDVADWQCRRAAAGLYDASVSYWRDVLAGPVPTMDLPTDRQRSFEQDYRPATAVRTLDSAVAAAVRAASARLGLAPVTIFLSAFDALLHRYTGEEDILVGLHTPGRCGPEVQGLVGGCDHAVVVRADVSERPTFRTLLGRVDTALAGACRHSDAPFELVVNELQPRRDLSRPPFFQVALACGMPASVPDPREPDVDVTVCGGLLIDLTLFVAETSGEIDLTAEYNRDLFDNATIERALTHYEGLLGEALAHLDTPVAALPLLSDAEHAQVVVEWNRTALDLGSAACVTQLVEAQAAATPDAVAVEFEGRVWTYRELNSRANQFAHYLRSAGVERETLVGVCLDRSPDVLIALLGILKAGGAYLPLDPTYPRARLDFMLTDAGVSTIVTDTSLTHLLPTDGRTLMCLDGDWRASAGDGTDSPAPIAGGGDLAYVIYTSGSTGTPKGVQVTRRALGNLLISMRNVLRPDARTTLLSVTTLAFDIAGLELFLPLTVGGRVVIVSRVAASDGRTLVAALAESSATMMQATPATWRLLLEAGWAPPRGFQILCGGEALPPDLAGRLASLAQTWNLYGPTEATIWSSIDCVGTGAQTVSIGRPIGNTGMYVLDPSLRPLPIGVPGELYIGGEGLARGYLNRPALTAERFVPNPFTGEAGGRLYRTGDRARFLVDGRIEWLERVDQQVKIRGYRIELREIEAALAAHASVQQAVAFVDGGAADPRLVAHVVFEPGESLTASELRRFARETLPPYMVPSFFLNVDRIPLTLNGKIDRRVLSMPLASNGVDVACLPPRTPIERDVAAIWQRALGTDAVGVHDNFFDVGGHSLLSMRVLAEIERTLGQRLSPRVMFLENLEQIAARIDRRGGDADTVAGEAAASRAGAQS